MDASFARKRNAGFLRAQPTAPNMWVMSLRRWIVLAIVLLASIGHMACTMLDENGWARRTRLTKDLLSAKTQNDALDEEVQTLRRKIRALASRKDVQERVVREELGYVRQNDVVLRFAN